ncbi:MAG: cupin domain-containing protein [Thermoplasmata archaeon]|nr:cupin domain-containing protein [Thermoplasmata archaeon]MCI4356320.1 cupin domain-containing protein [Thermoplasmata archaeon]
MALTTKFSVESLATELRRSSGTSVEFLRAPAMSAGVYLLEAGGTDHQSPHEQEELYYVVRGRGRFRSSTREIAVAPGDVLFVRAHEPHRFVEVVEDLVLLVVFAPAKTPAPP